jgi:hypothetical protein
MAKTDSNLYSRSGCSSSKITEKVTPILTR